MNYLHDFEECLINGNIECWHQREAEDDHSFIVIDEIPKFKSMIHNIVNDSICFDAGGIKELFNFKVIPELFKMPYRTMWVNFVVDSGKIKHLIGAKYGYLIASGYDAELDKSYVTIWVFVKNKTSKWWAYINSYQFYPGVDDGKYIMGDYIQEYQRKALIGMNHALQLFISAINCTNIECIKTDAPDKLNKKRLRKGKPPLYEYYTLALKGKSGGHLSKNGKHESPRFHLRRGHIREYKNGLFTWVNSCAVGDAKNGVIEKDYKLAAK